MKRRISELIKTPFKIHWLESALRRIISLTGTNNFLIHLIPTNAMYSVGELRICSVNGLRYTLNLSSFNNWSIYWRISSERQPKEALYQMLNPNDVILDVGAHIGEMTMNMARIVKQGLVLAIEGFPNTFERLSCHVKDNNFQNVILVNKAVGAYSGSISFLVDPANAGSNRVIDSAGSEDNKVEMETLDFIVDKAGLQKVDIIKMDVEGYEVNALKGARSILKRFNPKLFVEVSDVALKKQGSSADELLHLLKELGYRNFTDIRSSRPLDDNVNLNNIHTDILAVF